MQVQKHVTRRDFLRLGTLGAAGAVLITACGSPASPAPAATSVPATSAPAAKPTEAAKPAEPTKPAAAAAPVATPTPVPTAAAKPATSQGGTMQLLTWFAADSPARQVNLKIIQEYTDKHPGLKTEIQDVPMAEYQRKLQTMYAANQGPDLLWISIWRIGPFVKAGRFLQLDELYQGDKDSPKYLKGVLDDGKSQGKLYGMPTEASTWVTLYNKTMFEKAGLKTPEQMDQEGNWNPQSVVEAAKKLTVSEGGRVTSYGFLSEPQVYTWATYARVAGGKLIDDARTKFTLNQKENVEALQWLGDVINEYKVAPGLTDTQQEGYLPRLTNQRLAMTNNWNVYVADVKRAIADKFEFDIYYPPYTKQKAGWTHSNLISITQTTKFRDQAWELARILPNSDSVKRRLAVGYGETPLLDDPSVQEAYTKLIPVEHTGIVADLMKPEARITLPYNDNWEEQRYKVIEPGMQQVLLGKAKAADIMAKMEADANELMPK